MPPTALFPLPPEDAAVVEEEEDAALESWIRVRLGSGHRLVEGVRRETAFDAPATETSILRRWSRETRRENCSKRLVVVIVVVGKSSSSCGAFCPFGEKIPFFEFPFLSAFFSFIFAKNAYNYFLRLVKITHT